MREMRPLVGAAAQRGSSHRLPQVQDEEVERETMTTAQDFPFGIKSRPFNYNLSEAIKDKGFTRNAFAAELGCSVQQLYRYLRFAAYPKPARRQRISLLLRVLEEDIFPDRLKDLGLTRQPEAIAISESDAKELMLIPSDDGPLDSDAELLAPQIHEALATLEDRERLVIEIRYGFRDGQAHTFEDIGIMLGVTRERIRQINAKALRKLRHPSRSKKLRDFLE